MPEINTIIVVAAVAFVFAGFVKGVLGQGLPTVAVGLLSLVMSPGEAAALVVIPALITNIWQAWFGPSLVPLLRRLWPTLLASFIGTFVATWVGLGLLTPETATLARKALGIALILYGLLGISRVRLQVPPRAEPWLGPLFGATNGAVSTATGVFMFPVIPYIQSLGMDRDDLVQAQGISFTVSTLALTMVVVSNGTLNATNAVSSFIAMAITFVGMFLGQYVRNLVQPELFRFLFYVGVLLLGVNLAFIR
ncbi:MAG: sulfite exporter TauE/SafE family protein [Alphaproteobacteria bacterium]|nr:sulfite exporter TauE/SafE family protein [Alphaproteobacteria bacterium]